MKEDVHVWNKDKKATLPSEWDSVHIFL